MERVSFNVARLHASSRASREAVARALEAGVRCFDVNASNAGAVEVLSELLLPGSVGSEVRVVARIGYHETAITADAKRINDRLSHSLDAAFVRDEAEKLATVFHHPVEVLLHNPEELAEERQVGTLAKTVDELTRMNMDIIARLGVSTNQPRDLVSKWAHVLDSVTLRRAPACALDSDARRSALMTAARGHELIGYRPFLHVDGLQQRRLIQGYHAAAAAAGAAGVDYVAACEAAISYFTPPVDLDDAETVEGCRWIQQLIADLNSGVSQFSSFEQYEHELATQIVPMLHSKFEELDADSAELLHNFFAAYGTTVRQSVESTTRRLAAAASAIPGVAPLGESESLATWALRRVLARSELSLISIAFESPEDVDAVAKVVQKHRQGG